MSSQRDATLRRPGVAVIGCGRMGAGFHLPALAAREDVDLRALVDPRRDAAEHLAARHGVPHVLTSAHGLQGAGVTVAIVAVPNRQHAEMATFLLEQGIDVLVEKPLAPTLAECEQISAAARTSGRVAAVGLPLRTAPAAQLAHDLIAAGELGRITEVTVEYGTGRARPPATDPRRQRETLGGGVLVDLGSHVLDLLVWWLGELDVMAYRDDAHGGVEADATVDLALPSGADATVELSWTRELAQVAVLRGECGTLEVGLGRNHLAWRSPASGRALRGTVLEAGTERRADGLAGLVHRVHDEFFATVRGEQSRSVGAQEASRSVAIIEDCYARRRPLTAPWVAGTPVSEATHAPGEARSSLRGARVLVTGGTGFIGGRLVEELVLGHGAEVRALARPGSDAARLLRFPIDLRWGSVNDPQAVAEAVAGCDVVIHCAHDTGSPLRNRASGVQGTQTVVQAARRAGVRRLVHLSSAVVYGSTADGDLHEGTPWGRTRDPYALAKRGGERIVEAGHEAGLPSVILQPTIVYGPWGKRWTVGCIEQMSTGAVAVLDGGRGLCNVVYVDDVIAAILLAAGAPGAPGERFLVSAADPVTWHQFYAGFEQVLGRTATVSVAAESLNAVARAQRRRLRRELTRGAVSRTRALLLEPEMRGRLRTLPEARLAMTLIEDAVGPARWARLKAIAADASPVPTAPQPSLLHLPGANVAAEQRSRTRVRIDHARAVLGYEPRHALEQGLEATEAFLRWARLAGGVPQ